MGPLGSFIRLTPLLLDELPSHPALETRFRNSIGMAGRKNGTRPTSNPQALRDVSNLAQNRPNAQLDTPADLKDGSSSPRRNPNSLNGFIEFAPDTPHDPDDGILSDASTYDHTGRPNLIPFIKAILDEATTFVDISIPRTFFEGSLKSSPPSTAKVRLLKRTISSDELSQIPWEGPRIPRKAPPGVKPPSEAWFARSSTHKNQNIKGSADFSEFDFALRADHSQHEREYTPDVFDDFKVLDWDLRPTPYNLAIGNYRHITMGSEYLLRFPGHSISLLAGIMLILGRSQSTRCATNFRFHWRPVYSLSLSSLLKQVRPSLWSSKFPSISNRFRKLSIATDATSKKVEVHCRRRNLCLGMLDLDRAVM